MKLSDFDYELPKELIAQFPLKDRDKARLLAVERRTGLIKHGFFSGIAGYFSPGDVLVLNDTRVLNCRLHGEKKTGGRIEVFLLRHKGAGVFDALIRPGRLKQGDKVFFAGKGIHCALSGKNEVRFSVSDLKEIYSLGKTPLPPYIKRAPLPEDSVYYQTVYAKHDGSVASPTAGLHFTRTLLKDIEAKGVKIVYVTLHVGHATFKPVKAEDIREHKMDTEYFDIPNSTLECIRTAKDSGKRVFAVGTTTCRALEAYFSADYKDEGSLKSTGIFIFPGYEFKAIDCLITNFHLPRTGLFILVSAFAGNSLARRAYLEAVREGYRFYSYGDCMLIV